MSNPNSSYPLVPIETPKNTTSSQTKRHRRHFSLRHLWQSLIRPAQWPNTGLQLPPHQVHRGLHRNGIQENTLEAFRAAKASGALMCETDVRLSRDHIPVLVHDADLRRVSGHEHQVKDLSAQELKTLAHVPTLVEALTDPKCPRFFNIELKSKSINDPLAASVAQVIEELRAQSRVIFSSFNPIILWKMQHLLPTVPRALLVTHAHDPSNGWLLREMIFAPFIKLHMLNLDQELLTDEALHFWLKQEMPISAWTVNQEDKASKLLQNGVRSIISDLPPPTNRDAVPGK